MLGVIWVGYLYCCSFTFFGQMPKFAEMEISIGLPTSRLSSKISGYTYYFRLPLKSVVSVIFIKSVDVCLDKCNQDYKNKYAYLFSSFTKYNLIIVR